MMKHSRGKYTNKQVDRCAQMGGAFGKKVDEIFTASGLGSFETFSKMKRPSHSQDILLFTKEYLPDALFDYIPIRHHTGFQHFCLKSVSCIKKPGDMGKKLEDLSRQVDLWREITLHHASSN